VLDLGMARSGSIYVPRTSANNAESLFLACIYLHLYPGAEAPLRQAYKHPGTNLSQRGSVACVIIVRMTRLRKISTVGR